MNDHNIGRHQKAIAELNVPEQYYSAIGRFIAEFSALEFLLKWIIADSVKLSDEDSTAIISHDFAMLCTIVQKVLPRKLGEPQQTRLADAIKKCRELNEKRVRIVHGFWLIGHKRGRLQHASRQKLEARMYYEISAQEIAAEADLANQLWGDLVPFWERAVEKPRERSSPG